MSYNPVIGVAGSAIGTAGPFTSSGSTIIFAATGHSADPGIGGVVDNKGNTYTKIGVSDFGTASVLYYCQAPNVGTGHIIEVLGTPAFSSISVGCFSGGDNALNTFTVGGTVSAVASTQPAALTPNVAQQIVITTLATDGSPAGYNINSGFTIIASAPAISAVRYGSALAYLINPPLSSLQPTWSWIPNIQPSTVMGLINEAFPTGEIKTRNEVEVNPTPAMKARNGLARASIKRINELLVN